MVDDVHLINEGLNTIICTALLYKPAREDLISGVREIDFYAPRGVH